MCPFRFNKLQVSSCEFRVKNKIQEFSFKLIQRGHTLLFPQGRENKRGRIAIRPYLYLLVAIVQKKNVPYNSYCTLFYIRHKF